VTSALKNGTFPISPRAICLCAASTAARASSIGELTRRKSLINSRTLLFACELRRPCTQRATFLERKATDVLREHTFGG